MQAIAAKLYAVFDYGGGSVIWRNRLSKAFIRFAVTSCGAGRIGWRCILGP